MFQIQIQIQIHLLVHDIKQENLVSIWHFIVQYISVIVNTLILKGIWLHKWTLYKWYVLTDQTMNSE